MKDCEDIIKKKRNQEKRGEKKEREKRTEGKFNRKGVIEEKKCSPFLFTKIKRLH